MADRTGPDPDPNVPVPGPTGSRRSWWQRLVAGPVDPATGLQWSGLAAAAERRCWPMLDEDPTLAPLLADAPLRLTAEHRAAPVVRGRSGTWDMLACEVRYLMPRGELSLAQYAVTALPVPLPLPALRISPRRFLSHATAGLLVVSTGAEDFDSRWRVLASQDSPEVRGLIGPELQATLLDGPDVDEVWTAAGHLAASRADGHHDALIDQHTSLLTAAMTGLQRAL